MANDLQSSACFLRISVSDSRASNTAAPMSRQVNVQTINDNVRTFCFFILRATPWCWPPPAPYQRRRHLSCRSSRGHWAPTALAEPHTSCTGPVAVPHTGCRVHPPSVQHSGRGLPTSYPSHHLRAHGHDTPVSNSTSRLVGQRTVCRRRTHCGRGLRHGIWFTRRDVGDRNIPPPYSLVVVFFQRRLHFVRTDFPKSRIIRTKSIGTQDVGILYFIFDTFNKIILR